METTDGVSRRWALKAAGAAGAAAIVTGAGAGAAHADDDQEGDGRGSNRGVEPTAGTWKTWVLSSAPRSRCRRRQRGRRPSATSTQW